MKFLNEAQLEQLKQISEYLLKVRLEKSIRIEEVAARTHIRLAFLQALEAGRFEELPEPVYVQGFIRRYGDVLGLDGTALANTFNINISLSDSNTDNSTNNSIKNDSQNVDRRLNIHIPLFIPYIVLLVVASIGLIYILNPKLIIESFAKQQNPVHTPKPKTAPSPVPSLSKVQSGAPTAKLETTPLPVPSLAVTPSESTISQNVKVTLELQDKSWIRVKVDGKTEFVGDLTKGEQRTWTAQKQLTVRSGNAGAVLITVNNQPAKPLGNPGAVKEVTFTPEVNGQ